MVQNLPVIWTTFERKFVPKTFQNRPIWSHWSIAKLMGVYNRLGPINLRTDPHTGMPKIYYFHEQCNLLTEMFDPFIHLHLLTFAFNSCQCQTLKTISPPIKAMKLKISFNFLFQVCFELPYNNILSKITSTKYCFKITNWWGIISVSLYILHSLIFTQIANYSIPGGPIAWWMI